MCSLRATGDKVIARIHGTRYYRHLAEASIEVSSAKVISSAH